MIITVWYRRKHTDYTATDIEITSSVAKWIFDTKEEGGFYVENGFIPWHCINYIEKGD